jgi:hypothetical protein
VKEKVKKLFFWGCYAFLGFAYILLIRVGSLNLLITLSLGIVIVGYILKTATKHDSSALRGVVRSFFLLVGLILIAVPVSVVVFVVGFGVESMLMHFAIKYGILPREAMPF